VVEEEVDGAGGRTSPEQADGPRRIGAECGGRCGLVAARESWSCSFSKAVGSPSHGRKIEEYVRAILELRILSGNKVRQGKGTERWLNHKSIIVILRTSQLTQHSQREVLRANRRLANAF
jgi:hypothetical protein